MPIEEIIYLTDFHSLYKDGNYWEITFESRERDGGLYKFFGTTSPFKYFKVYKPINHENNTH